MKIAMTLSGQPRRVDAGFKELKKHFLDKYDIDIYLHAWQDKYFYKYHYGEIMHKYKVDPTIYSKVLDLYQPKEYLFEKGIRFDSAAIEDESRMDGHFGMLLSMKRAWDMLEKSNIKYDLVIRARYDIFYSHYSRKDHYLLNNLENLDPNKVHAFRKLYDQDANLNVNDQFAIGGYDVMKDYHNFFSYLIHYYFNNTEYKTKMNNHNSSHYYVETSLRQYFRDKNIEFAPENEKPLWDIWWDSIVILR